MKNMTFTVSTFNMGYDARQSFLGIANSFGNGALGLAVSGVTVDDIEYRDGNDIRRGTFRHNSNAVSLSYGHSFGNVGIGLGVGVLTDVYSLDAERINGFRGADIGIIGQRTYTMASGKEIPIFTYGLAVRNLGSSHNESAVPMLVDAGVAFKLPKKGAGVTFSLMSSMSSSSLTKRPQPPALALNIKSLNALPFAAAPWARVTTRACLPDSV